MGGLPCRKSLFYSISHFIYIYLYINCIFLSVWIRLPICHSLLFSFSLCLFLLILTSSPKDCFSLSLPPAFLHALLFFLPISPPIPVFSTPPLSSHTHPTRSPAAGELGAARRSRLSQMVNSVVCRYLSCSLITPLSLLPASSFQTPGRDV